MILISYLLSIILSFTVFSQAELCCDKCEQGSKEKHTISVKIYFINVILINYGVMKNQSIHSFLEKQSESYEEILVTN